MSELIDCINNLSAKDIIKSAAKTANGVPFYLQTSGLGGFVAEYQAVYDVFSVKPPAAIAATQNTMVAGLVDGGYWAGLDWFYDAGSYAEADVLINWVNPGTYTLTKNGVITWVQNTGVTSNGTTGYYNTNCNFGDGGSHNYVQDDAMVFCYVRTDVQGTTAEFGTVGVGDCYCTFRNAVDQISMRINDDSNVPSGVASTDSRGLWALVRNTTDKRLWRNGTSFANAVNASTGVQNSDIYLLAWNNSGPGIYSTRQVSIWGAGKYSTMNIPAITTIIETYMDAKGVGVIP